MELSRRRFMQFLSAAPIALAFDPRRKIFDMGRNQIWTPPPVELIPAQMGYWIELGGDFDLAVQATLAQFGQSMEQTHYYGDSEQRIVLATNRKSSLQV